MRPLPPIAVGDVFGRLTVLEVGEPVRHQLHLTPCRCICLCGTERMFRRSNLLHGSQSCGCLRMERARAKSIKHGYARSKTYRAWEHMIGRCYRPNTPSYPRYGGRGITVCDSWRSFPNFLADMGEAPAGLEIDRINNDGNYEPGNCRWSTRKQQLANTGRSRAIVLNGHKTIMAEACRQIGVKPGAVYSRMARRKEDAQQAFDHFLKGTAHAQ